jgi:hypothetical protein
MKAFAFIFFIHCVKTLPSSFSSFLFCCLLIVVYISLLFFSLFKIKGTRDAIFDGFDVEIAHGNFGNEYIHPKQNATALKVKKLRKLMAPLIESVCRIVENRYQYHNNVILTDELLQTS